MSEIPNGPVPFITGNIPPEMQAILNKQAGAPIAPQFGPGGMLNPNSEQPVIPPPAVPRQPRQDDREVAPAAPGMLPNASLNDILNQLRSTNNVYEEIVLPSRGKFYNGSDGPTNGILHVRPMTGEEEQILATPRFVRKGTAINMIFSRCIQEPIKSENLLSADRTFLLIYLRGISYGTDYEVEVKDPETDRKFSTVIDLDGLPKNLCPDDFGPELRDTLPKSGLSFTYRLSRGYDELELQDHRERRLKQYGDSAADDTLIFRCTQLVESIADIVNKNEISLILRSLPIQDLSYMRNLVNEPPFGVDTKITIVSPLTSDEFEVELPLEAAFFFPRRRKKEPTQV